MKQHIYCTNCLENNMVYIFIVHSEYKYLRHDDREKNVCDTSLFVLHTTLNEPIECKILLY